MIVKLQQKKKKKVLHLLSLQMFWLHHGRKRHFVNSGSVAVSHDSEAAFTNTRTFEQAQVNETQQLSVVFVTPFVFLLWHDETSAVKKVNSTPHANYIQYLLCTDFHSILFLFQFIYKKTLCFTVYWNGKHIKNTLSSLSLLGFVSFTVSTHYLLKTCSELVCSLVTQIKLLHVASFPTSYTIAKCIDFSYTNWKKKKNVNYCSVKSGDGPTSSLNFSFLEFSLSSITKFVCFCSFTFTLRGCTQISPIGNTQTCH